MYDYDINETRRAKRLFSEAKTCLYLGMKLSEEQFEILLFSPQIEQLIIPNPIVENNLKNEAKEIYLNNVYYLDYYYTVGENLENQLIHK